MTAKDKAQELSMKYYNLESEAVLSIEDAKQCALIAVDEILNVLFQHHEIDFWKQVKDEINAL